MARARKSAGGERQRHRPAGRVCCWSGR